MTAYIQYKGYSSKTYNTQLCARRAQRNPFNLQSSPKCCLVLSNRNIYIPSTHTPQIVRTTYLIEMSYTQLCARRAQRNPFNLQSSPSVGMIYPIPTYIYNQLTYTLQIVASKYPIQILFFKNVRYLTLCPKGTKKPLQFTIIPQVLA